MRTYFTLEDKEPNNQIIPLQGVCQISQLFQGYIFHFSMDEEHSAATPDLLDDCRQSPTVHKSKYQLSDFLSQHDKDLPKGSKFPTFSEQIFQMNHLIKHKANFLMEMSFYKKYRIHVYDKINVQITKLRFYEVHMHTLRLALLITNIFQKTEVFLHVTIGHIHL